MSLKAIKPALLIFCWLTLVFSLPISKAAAVVTPPSLADFPAQAEPNALDEQVQVWREAFLVTFNTILRTEFNSRPLAPNPILDEIAQEIAALVGCTNERVEFDIQREALRLGYEPYPDATTIARTTRVPLLPAVNTRSVEEMARIYTSDIFQNNINLSGRFYREIGIGVSPCIVATDAEVIGTTTQYGLFVILGAQPNVIPLVIENGARQLEASELPLRVTLAIHQENSRQLDGLFGIVSRMRLSNAPLTAGVLNRSYEPYVTWSLESCGENTVYYELTDTVGLQVTGETSVEVICEE